MLLVLGITGVKITVGVFSGMSSLRLIKSLRWQLRPKLLSEVWGFRLWRRWNFFEDRVNKCAPVVHFENSTQDLPDMRDSMLNYGVGERSKDWASPYKMNDLGSRSSFALRL